MKRQGIFAHGAPLLDRWFTNLLSGVGYLLRPVWAFRAGKKETVLIKTVGGIGDFVLLSASFPGFRQLFPESRIVLLVRREVRDLAVHNPYIDALITVNLSLFSRSPAERVRVWWGLLSHHIDIAINADYSGHYESLDRTLLRWSMASMRIGFQCLDKNTVRDTSFYHRVVPANSEWMFEIDRNNQLLHYLGLEGYGNTTTTIWGLEKYIPTRGVSAALPNAPYYVLFPGSLIAEKCWPPEAFASVVKGLADIGWTPVVCGSTRESAIAKTIAASVSSSIIDLTGKTTLMDLSHIIRHSRFLLSNDSAAVHIAAAVGTLTFAILGGGHYGRFLPYPARSRIVVITNESYRECFNCYWVCKYERFRCIQDLPPVQVLTVVRQHLETLRDASPIVEAK